MVDFATGKKSIQTNTKLQSCISMNKCSAIICKDKNEKPLVGFKEQWVETWVCY